MTEQGIPQPAPGQPRLRDVGLIVLLLALVGTLRAAIVARTVVPARDTIGYIRYALELERFAGDGAHDLWDAWQTVLNRHHQHPGYPLTILAVSLPVRAWGAGTDAEQMQLSAQLASNLAAVLLVIPMFLFGAMLLDRRIAFWATLLFHVLPVSAHLLSDGLSEALFLLLSATALCFAVYGMRTRSVWPWLLCGLFCGLSYLTRPEGAVVLLSAGLVLAAAQFVTAWRRAWTRFAVAELCLLLPGIAVGAFYWSATHKFTNKPSVDQILNGYQVRSGAQVPRFEDAPPRTVSASVWAAMIKRGGTLTERVGLGLGAIGLELAQCFHYFGAIPVMIGFLWCVGRLWPQPGFWVVVVLYSLHAAVLCALVVNVGYVSDRHVMILVLCGSYCLACGLLELPAHAQAWLQLLGRPRATSQGAAQPRAVYGTALVLLLIALCLPKTFQPLHYNRAGHHAAGLWLAGQLHPGDEVQDDHCWSHYYAGEVFREGRPAVHDLGRTPLQYFVITRSGDPEIAPSRQMNEQKVKEADGVLVYHWPQDGPAEAARVVVYAVPRSTDVERGLLPAAP